MAGSAPSPRFKTLPSPMKADAIVGEIFSSLVITSTLAAEIRELEASNAAYATEAEVFSVASDSVQLAAEEAVQLAQRERGLRLTAQSKLRVLQNEVNTDSSTKIALDEQKKMTAARERELRDAKSKAQQAGERMRAAAHGLKMERQQSRQQRRAFGAQRILQLSRDIRVTSALRRCLISWRSKLDAGIFEIAHAPPPSAAAASSASATGSAADDHVAAHSSHAALLEVRNAECLALRERVAELEALVVHSATRDEALRKTAERAAKASEGLLEARKQVVEHAAALATAKAALERRNRPEAIE